MNNKILYIGGFNFIKQNASAIRAIEIAKFFKKIDYEIIVSGKIVNEEQYVEIEGINVFNINEKKISKKDFSIDITTVVTYVRKLEPKIIIAYNYPPIAFLKLLKFCKKNQLILIPDITEWHGVDGKLTLMKFLRARLIDYKMYVLNKKCEKIIMATDYLSGFYRKSDQLLLPFVTVEKSNESSLINSKTRNFIFAGTIGENFSKDRLDVVLKAFEQIKESNFRIHIIGPSKEELFSTAVKDSLEALNNKITLYGRLPNQEVLKILKHSDFVIFARDVKRITKVGYPTKVFEAFKVGIPVITNNTSNLDKHILNKENGFLIERLSVECFSSALKSAIEMSAEDLSIMKRKCAQSNPFYYKNYIDETKKFLNR